MRNTYWKHKTSFNHSICSFLQCEFYLRHHVFNRSGKGFLRNPRSTACFFYFFDSGRVCMLPSQTWSIEESFRQGPNRWQTSEKTVSCSLCKCLSNFKKFSECLAVSFSGLDMNLCFYF